MKLDKRKLRKQTRKHLKEMGWTSGDAYKQSKKIVEDEIKKIKYVMEFTNFLKEEKLNTFKIICRTKKGVEEVNFSVLDINNKVDSTVIPDIVITNEKENDNEIDIRFLRLPSHHITASMSNLKFEEDKAEDPKYLIQMIYHTFMFSIQDNSFNTFKYLKEEYLKIKE